MFSLDDHIERKRKIYAIYRDAFDDIPEITMNPYLSESKPNHWLSCLILPKGCKIKPLDIIMAPEAENIESRPLWKPMHLQPGYRDADETVAVSEDIFSGGLCLPSDIKNTAGDMDRILGIIRRLF